MTVKGTTALKKDKMTEGCKTNVDIAEKTTFV